MDAKILELYEMLDALGVGVEFDEISADDDGDYDHDARLIRIQHDLLYRRYVSTLAHETCHAVFGDVRTLFGPVNAKQERRADEWAALFLISLDDYRRQEARHDGHLEAMETAWRVHVEPKWAGREISGIKRSEIAEWVAELSKEKSAQTVRRIIFVLSGVLAIAARERAIPTNPAVGVALPAKRRKSPRYLSHTQVATLSSCADGDTEQILIELFAYSGPRWGEAVAIRVRHLNMLHKRIRIEDNAVIVNGEYKIGTPKSGEPRDIPIPPHLVKPIARLCEGKGPDEFVFGDGTDPIPYPHATSGWFVKAVRKAQSADNSIPSITPHDLRHTAASLAVSSGAHVKAVQRMLGHASAAMTLDVYADLFDDDLEAVAKAMSAARKAAVS